MKKHEYLALRNKLYSAIGSLGTEAENAKELSIEYKKLSMAYHSGCELLDYVDDLGDALGFLDENNEEV